MKLRITDVDVSNVEVTNNRNGLYATRNHFPLLSRILMSAIFIWSGIGKIMNFAGTQEYMSAYGMKFTSIFLVAAIAVLILGGLSLLLGIKPRYGAIALALFLIPSTFIFHTDFSDQIQQIMFMKNLAMLGGLLMLIQYGGGNIVIRR